MQSVSNCVFLSVAHFGKSKHRLCWRIDDQSTVFLSRPLWRDGDVCPLRKRITTGVEEVVVDHIYSLVAAGEGAAERASQMRDELPTVTEESY